MLLSFSVFRCRLFQGTSEFFEAVHGLGAWALIILLLAHIGAALQHHFKLNDETLLHMTFKK